MDLFDEISKLFHIACRTGDLEVIEIYLSEKIKNETKDLMFKINKTNKTASLFKLNNKQLEHLLIQQTVQHGSDEYLITGISNIWTFLKEEFYKIENDFILYPPFLLAIFKEYF